MCYHTTCSYIHVCIIRCRDSIEVRILTVPRLLQLKAASDYDERSAIRKALRQLKKEQGRPVGRQSKREATYNRFAGRALSTSKPAVTPHKYYGTEAGGVSHTTGSSSSATHPLYTCCNDVCFSLACQKWYSNPDPTHSEPSPLLPSSLTYSPSYTYSGGATRVPPAPLPPAPLGGT